MPAVPLPRALTERSAGGSKRIATRGPARLDCAGPADESGARGVIEARAGGNSSRSDGQVSLDRLYLSFGSLARPAAPFFLPFAYCQGGIPPAWCKLYNPSRRQMFR